MSKEDILHKFNYLLDETISKQDKESMEISRAMFKKAVCVISNYDVNKAEEFVECFEGNLKYNNYLSKHEAETILSEFINEDGTTGAKISGHNEFFQVIEELNGKIEHEPYYNKWALYVTANKFASDHHSVIVKWAGSDKFKFIEACYDLAVTQLKDKDKANWVRWYFGVNSK